MNKDLPGHIRKAFRSVDRYLPVVDVIVELVDSRMPNGSRLKNFVGLVKFQGSCADTPNQSASDWFDIDTIEYIIGKPHHKKHHKKCCQPTSDDSSFEPCDCRCCCDRNEKIYIHLPFNGNVTKTYQLNSLWVRIQYIRELDAPATIEEVDYRN